MRGAVVPQQVGVLVSHAPNISQDSFYMYRPFMLVLNVKHSVLFPTLSDSKGKGRSQKLPPLPEKSVLWGEGVTLCLVPHRDGQ